jgi:hypothetical protein
MAAISESIGTSSAGSRALLQAEAWSFGPMPSERLRLHESRRLARLAAALVFVTVVGWLLLGVPSLVGGWYVQGLESMHRVHEIGWGVYTTFVLGVGVVAYAWSPGRNVAPLQQAVLGTVAGGTSMVMAGALVPTHLMRGAVVAAPIAVLVLLDPERGRLFRPGRVKPALIALATISAVPFLRFAEGQLRIQQSDRLSPHAVLFHWGTMATLAIAIVLVALLAGLGTSGWRISAWSAGLSMMIFGLASGVLATYPSSVGLAPGVAATAMGLAFVCATEWEVRRAQTQAAVPTSVNVELPSARNSQS